MWSLEPLKGQSKIQRTMNRDTNYTFRVVAQRRLSDRENPNNHFSKDRDKPCAILISGKEIRINKGKEKSKSKETSIIHLI